MRRRILLGCCALAALAAVACEEGEPGTPTATITAGPPTATVEEHDPSATPPPTPDDGLLAIEIRGSASSATVRVELAVTREEVTTGLMHRQSLDEDAGMLFVFETPSHTGFWMRNTLIPLDIAYMDAEGTIKEIHRGEPLNETLLRPALPYWYVLEVNAGWFERHGLGVGDRAIIPDGANADQEADEGSTAAAGDGSGTDVKR